MILSYKFRVKDATTGKILFRHAYSANQVWNFCVSTQREAERRWKGGMKARWPTAFDLIKLCTGSGSLIGLHSDTVQAVCRQFAVSRDSKQRCPRYRSSLGPRRSLGWVPFVPRAVRIDGSQVIYLKRKFSFWKSRDFSHDGFKAGCFTQDARGRWYVIFQCEVAEELPTGIGSVGIDLGLKAVATLSDGATIPALRHYRVHEAVLAVAQRSGNKRRVRAIHAKIANSRRHQMHEASARIVRENSFIAVGNVSAAKLAKTKMAKSVLDASWGMLRSQIHYKARRHGSVCIDVDERWTSQLCSDCGVVGGPKGIAQIGVRHWDCSCCGASHDRDVNAARNILRVGLERQAPAVEIPALPLGRR